MKIDFSTVPADIVEDWKHHPGTLHLIGQLAEADRHWVKRMVIDACATHHGETISSHGGRCAELRQIIEDIKEAKGVTSERK